MTKRRVVVTGLGIVSPHGTDVRALMEALCRGESAVGLVRGETEAGVFEIVGAEVKSQPWTMLSKGLIAATDRCGLLALVAVENALRDSGIDLSSEDLTRVGISVGTSLGGALSQEAAYAQLFRRPDAKLSPFTLVRVMYNGPAAQIGLRYGIAGPSLTHTNTCSSSTVAIGEAAEKIRTGSADVMLAGGTEAPFAYVSIKAWQALQVIAPTRPENPSTTCRPFSADRAGTVLGEGSAFLILEEHQRAMRRGAQVYAELAGYAVVNDCSHMTQPSLDAQVRAMTLALLDAGIDRSQVDYINAHGTGTRLNDQTETEAIKVALREHSTRVAVSSTKSMHGHLIGAAGALEALITACAINQQTVPPTAHLHHRDPALDLDYVPHRGRACHIRTALTNSFAVGGTASTLALRAP